MEKERITVELLFYNDLKNLQRSIPSYIDQVDKVIALNGRHSTNKINTQISDDGSTEYLKSFDKITVLDCIGSSEVDKRKFAKHLCKTNTLIIIDSDEYVIGDWEKFHESYNKIRVRDVSIHLYKLKLQRLDSPDAYYFHPLVFYKPWEFTYYEDQHNLPIHHNFRNVPMLYAPRSFSKPIEGITIMHDHSLRTPEHNKIREEHLDYLSHTSL